MSFPLASNSFTFRTIGATDVVVLAITDVIGIRSSTSLIKVYVDGVESSSSSTADSGTIPDVKPSYGGISTSDTLTPHRSAFREQVAFNGGLITTTDLSNIRSRVAALNVALGRS